jgi:hypothetical protein
MDRPWDTREKGELRMMTSGRGWGRGENDLSLVCTYESKIKKKKNDAHIYG